MVGARKKGETGERSGCRASLPCSAVHTQLQGGDNETIESLLTLKALKSVGTTTGHAALEESLRRRVFVELASARKGVEMITVITYHYGY